MLTLTLSSILHQHTESEPLVRQILTSFCQHSRHSEKFVIGSYKTATSMFLADLLRFPVAKQSDMVAGPFPHLSLVGHSS